MLATWVIKNLTDDFMIRPTSKEFWALNALLVAYGLRLQIGVGTAARSPPRSAAG
jgi:hypothetical protein